MKPNANDPCHCGSGKKYKKCCMLADEKKSREASAATEAAAIAAAAASDAAAKQAGRPEAERVRAATRPTGGAGGAAASGIRQRGQSR